MQYRCLQFYRLLSNIATNLIGVFVPLIMFKFASNYFSFQVSLIFAVLSLVLDRSLSALFIFILRKKLFKYPQIFLLLRVIPLVGYILCIIFLSQAFLPCAICLVLFSSISYTFNQIPSEAIYNYTTVEKDGKALGIIKFVEQMGFVGATIIGGLFLDKIDEKYVAIISLGLYLISIIPLVIFYIQNKKNPTFNQESVSNMTEYYQKTNNKVLSKLQNKFCFKYYISYVLLCYIDSFYYLISLYLYLKTGSFFMSGLLCGLFDGVYGITSFFAGFVHEKHDLKYWSMAIAIIIPILYCITPFVNITWFTYAVFIFNGAIYPFLVVYLQQTMLVKSRILGVSNRAILYRLDGWLTSESTIYLFACFGTMVPCFFIACALSVLGGIMVPYNEESTNRMLVDFINQNEIPTSTKGVAIENKN